MSTKTPDRRKRSDGAASSGPAQPTFPDTVAYWLEDERGQRISWLCVASGGPLRLAGRALENTGSLAGWSLVRRSVDGTRHVIASDGDLETMVTPFLPQRSPEEAARFQQFRRAIREQFGPPRRAHVIRDERVY